MRLFRKMRKFFYNVWNVFFPYSVIKIDIRNCVIFINNKDQMEVISRNEIINEIFIGNYKLYMCEKLKNVHNICYQTNNIDGLFDTCKTIENCSANTMLKFEIKNNILKYWNKKRDNKFIPYQDNIENCTVNNMLK